MEAWHKVFGRDDALPTMLYFECPLEVLEQRILGRARYSGRADDNIEAMKLRFDTFKAETLPIVEHFKAQNSCVELDTSQGREGVYALVREQLAPYTDAALLEHPLTEQAEILLGLRPYPRES